MRFQKFYDDIKIGKLKFRPLLFLDVPLCYKLFKTGRWPCFGGAARISIDKISDRSTKSHDQSELSEEII